jgi:hypothetical protein
MVINATFILQDKSIKKNPAIAGPLLLKCNHLKEGKGRGETGGRTYGET